MAASNLPVRPSDPQTAYDGHLIESLFAIVDRVALSTSSAPEFDPEDDIELEIRTRTAGILTVGEVLDRVNRRAS
jgi:hypothetical protein